MTTEKWLRVGEVAERTGLTVRTLHHWDDVGLVKPGRRNSGGHRLYGAHEIARLQHVIALRALGFDLESIRGLLDDPSWTLAEALDRQLAMTLERLEETRRLAERLERARNMVDEPDWDIDVFLDAIEETVMEKYYTDDQLAELAERAEQLGPDGMRKAQDDWANLFAEFEEHRRKGTAPGAPELEPLLAEQQRLIAAFTGGNPEIRANLQRLYEEEGAAKASHDMMDAELAEYIAAAQAANS